MPSSVGKSRCRVASVSIVGLRLARSNPSKYVQGTLPAGSRCGREKFYRHRRLRDRRILATPINIGWSGRGYHHAPWPRQEQEFPCARSWRFAVTAPYTAMELMICCAARLLENGRTVAVGTGVPCAAAMLAQRTHAPDLVILFEAGGVAPQLPTMPISVGDSRAFYRGVMATSMADVMETAQRGLVDYTFLGGAQIDAYGNLNSTLIGGDYAKPRVRLPGSGGASDRGELGWRILVVATHDPRRFVSQLDFL